MDNKHLGELFLYSDHTVRTPVPSKLFPGKFQIPRTEFICPVCNKNTHADISGRVGSFNHCGYEFTTRGNALYIKKNSIISFLKRRENDK